MHVGLGPLGVLLDEDLGGNLLSRQRGDFRNFRDRGEGKLLRVLAHGLPFVVRVFRVMLAAGIQCRFDIVRQVLLPPNPFPGRNQSDIMRYGTIGQGVKLLYVVV